MDAKESWQDGTPLAACTLNDGRRFRVYIHTTGKRDPGTYDIGIQDPGSDEWERHPDGPFPCGNPYDYKGMVAESWRRLEAPMTEFTIGLERGLIRIPCDVGPYGGFAGKELHETLLQTPIPDFEVSGVGGEVIFTGQPRTEVDYKESELAEVGHSGSIYVAVARSARRATTLFSGDAGREPHEVYKGIFIATELERHLMAEDLRGCADDIVETLGRKFGEMRKSAKALTAACS